MPACKSASGCVGRLPSVLGMTRRRSVRFGSRRPTPRSPMALHPPALSNRAQDPLTPSLEDSWSCAGQREMIRASCERGRQDPQPRLPSPFDHPQGSLAASAPRRRQESKRWCESCCCIFAKKAGPMTAHGPASWCHPGEPATPKAVAVRPLPAAKPWPTGGGGGTGDRHAVSGLRRDGDRLTRKPKRPTGRRWPCRDTTSSAMC